jgi:hypothetical protein
MIKWFSPVYSIVEIGSKSYLLNGYYSLFKKTPARNKSQIILVSVFVIALFTLLTPSHSAFAATVVWDFNTGHSTNDGGIHSLDDHVFFTVTDPTLAGDLQISTISVLVNSTSDQAGITLTLTEDPSDNGVFTNTNLIFTNGTSQFHITNTVDVNLDAPAGNIDSSQVDFDTNSALPGGITIYSSTDTTGISFTLKETGKNTGIFRNPLHFNTTSSVVDSIIQANPGDIVSIFNSDSGQYQNWLIIPNPDPALGALPAKDGDKVTAIYGGVKAQTLLNAASGSGGGGGGLIRPGLVLDFISGIIGGSPNIVSPPSFGGGVYPFPDGLTLIQGDKTTIFDTSKYNQEIPKQVMTTDTKVNMTFKTFESYNPTAVIHMGLYLIPRGEDMIIPNSIASIVYDKKSPVEINDPNHILSNAAASSRTDGTFQYTEFSFVPAKSYDKMSFLIRAWNDHKYSADIRVHDEIDTPPSPKTLPAGVILYNDFNDLQAALEKDQFFKNQFMAHIHSSADVFGSSDGGHVYWLYDTIHHCVTLVIADKNDDTLVSYTDSLEPIVSGKKGDYGFMKFTVTQLNRSDKKQEEQFMKIEEAKALLLALKNGFMKSNW